jgi:hypothetical protein
LPLCLIKNILWGLAFHEIAGFILCFAFIFHFLINFKWINSISKLIFNPGKKVKFKTLLGYVLNWFLFIGTFLIVLSGLAMAEHFLPELLVLPFNDAKSLHFFVSSLTLILGGVHVGLHWGIIRSFFKKKLKIQLPVRFTKVASPIFAIFLMILGGYVFINSSMPRWIAMPFQTLLAGENNNQEIHQEREPHPEGMEKLQNVPSIDISSTFVTLGKFLSILALFAIITYYLEQILLKRTKKIE